MKRITTKVVTLLSTLSVSGTVMAHGGHEETASFVLHDLYHLVADGSLPIALAIGTVAVLLLSRSTIAEAVRRFTDRN